MLQPSVNMLTPRIFVGPVNDAAPIVGFKLTVERDGVAFGDRSNARCEIDIVSDQYRPAGRQSEDEALVSTTVVVVGKYAINSSAATNLATRTPAAVAGRRRSLR